MFEGYEIVIQENLPKLLEPKSIATAVALALLIVLFIVISKKTTFSTRVLTYGAIAISLAFVLSFFRIVKLPYGGSITLASMLPIFIFSYIAGARAGMAAGLVYGLLQYIQDAWFAHWVQFLLDYPIAFALLGLAGAFRKNIYLGAFVGCFGRMVCHFLSGVVFFAEYAGDQNVLWYSFVYNGTYLFPELVICIGVLAVSKVRTAIAHVRSVSTV